MNLKVTSSENKVNDVELKDYTINEIGRVVEATEDMQIAEVKKILPKPSTKTFYELSTDEFTEKIDKRLKAVEAIKSKFIEGKHYLTLSGVEKSILTQEGADLLFASAGIVVKTIEEKEILDHDKQFYFVSFKAIAEINGEIVAQTIASANSKEENNIMKFLQKQKDGTYAQRGIRTFYDTLNTVIRMSQKRAKVALARQFFAITGEFADDSDNPKANKRTQQSVYIQFYKLFMEFAPKPKTKTKLKNGKWKQLSLTDQLKQKKEDIRTEYLQPWLLKNGLPTYDWGIKDVEFIKTNLPAYWEEINKKRKGVQNEPIQNPNQ